MVTIDAMKKHRGLSAQIFVLSLLGAVAFACSGKEESGGSGDGDGDRPDDGATGAICEVAEDCFPDVEEGALAGDALCLDRVDEGYCTHDCAVDEDCCAADGECDDDFDQVCAPFESTGLMLCFLSCENEDVMAAGAEDDSAFCQEGAGSDFICRSSGGGSANRKICVPGDCGVGEDCREDADCGTDLVCVKDYEGGYCAQIGCSADSECPTDTVCVDDGGAENICLKTCTAASDCTFCRADSVQALCDTGAISVDGVGASVCLPERL
jgi:hypothetical protein